MTLRRFVLGFLLGAVSCSSALFAPARAEVSAKEAVTILLHIVDDPEPFGAWKEEGGTGSGRRVLNAEGFANGDGAPTIVVHPMTRMPIVAWARNSTTGFAVVVSRFDRDSWSPPTVLEDVSGDALDPHLVIDPANGDVHLFYWLNDGVPRVLHRSAPADLSTWSEPTLVSQPGEIASRPSAVIQGGRQIVVYESHSAGFGATPRQLVVAERNDDAWLFEVVAGSTFAGANSPQIHRQYGRTWVEWFDGDDVMRWSSRREGEPWTSLGSERFSGPEDREFHVRGRVRSAVRMLE